MSATAVQPHPIDMRVGPDLHRSRLTVFFRLVLVIPHVFWIVGFAVLAYIVYILAWLVALVTGRVPAPLHNFVGRFVRYFTRLSAYLYLLTENYPTFLGSSGGHSVDVLIAPPARQGRLKTLFRLLLVLPASVFVYVFRLINQVVAIFGWFVVLVTGRMPEGMQNLSAWLLRYEVQTMAYIFVLTDRYPSLSGLPSLG